MNKKGLKDFQEYTKTIESVDSVNITELAERFGISKSYVRNKLKPSTKFDYTKAVRDFYLSNQEDFLKEMEMGIEYMVMKFKVSKGTIRRIMQEHNKKESVKKFNEKRELNDFKWDRTEQKPYWETSEIVEVGQRPIQGVKFEKNKAGYLY